MDDFYQKLSWEILWEKCFSINIKFGINQSQMELSKKTGINNVGNY